MAEKIRIILDENHDVVRVEANLDGEWKELEGKKASTDDGVQTMGEPGGCGTGSANCEARPDLCLVEFSGRCYYYPC